MSYAAPLDHMRFVLENTSGLDRVRALSAFAELSPDVVEAVLDGAARFAAEVLAPLNAPGDRAGAKLTPEGVVTPPGFRQAYQRYVADGWNSLGGPAAFGGQGMPFALQAATIEMWGGANMSFALCPELGSGAIAALVEHGSDAVRARYLPKMVSGEWSGTMCLTEPQAGSDLSTVTTRAEPDGDAWRLTGRKIYITWGEHDMAENIIHLVLARAPNAPSGIKGISLFAVPRYSIGDDGRPGAPNDIRCVSIEHKMGLHASPTCVLALGDGGGARGHLVGPLHQGIVCMFTMMNHMRLGVGLHALGLAERAYQVAARHARERIQGRDAGGRPTAILGHADVRRMLLTMKAQIQAARGLCYSAAAALDIAHHSDGDQAAAAQTRADLLTPIVKAWCSDMAIEVTSIAVQVLGGMGFVEDAAAAQCYRDVRITAIYEGTNGIQAQDLMGRKVLKDGGRALDGLLAEMRVAAAALDRGDVRAAALGDSLTQGIAELEATTRLALTEGARDPEFVGATAVSYLALAGLVCGAWQWARTLASSGAMRNTRAREALFDTAAFYAAQLMPRAKAHAMIVKAGSQPVTRPDREFV